MASFRFDPQSLFRRNSKKRSAKKAPKPSRTRSTLGFEQLETRTLMAADLAEVLGTVRLDLQGDGNPANDDVVVGAAVSIYRDNGNGVFDAADALAKNAVSTDALGKYRFANLTAGKYFVKVELPAGSQFTAGQNIRTIDVSALEAEGTSGPAIDGFTTFQSVSAAPPLPKSNASSQADAAVMGGERDLFVELTQGTDPFSGVSLVSGAGLFRLSSDSNVTGNAKIVWDGVDGSAAINPIGLGGLDFTHFNGNTMTGIALRSGADHANSVIKLRVYTDATHWSEFTTTVPETVGGSATGLATFNFATPTSTGGGGADFANVGAVELTFEGVTAVDGQVDLVGLVGFTTKQADFTAYPRLALGDRVWADIDRDGLLDAGEQGIGGVTLQLYSDTNGDNTFTPGTDVQVATTTTDGNGFYMFNDLLPGSYIVLVTAANFNVGGPLAGLISSVNPSTGADPDNDVDNDDNGDPFAGYGIVSHAITLTSSETANDGDGNTKTNRTLDFGFVGFDLVLDKSANKTSVSPGEEITWTVVITNTGPSIASDVWFVDDFPVDATITGSSVSNGKVLENNGRSLMANLGNMAKGDVITVTVHGIVKNSAVNPLFNYARVEARDEVNLDNNRDQVSTPIVPKIDLMIDKSDSKDPVQPGQTFSYTLAVKNNGPSNATGVIVEDNLPAGITLVSTSQANVGSGSQLRFELGNMANGATSSIQVTVRVNSNFEGTLLNQAQVSANEEEITLTNNVDTEPTTVTVLPANLGGGVYVDKNDNGVWDSGEAPIAGVTVILSGNDQTGAPVTRTLVTGADGKYLFTNLKPGSYSLKEIQPTAYKDGKDTIGDNGDGVYNPVSDGLPLEDLDISDDHDLDAFSGIILEGGNTGRNYNFGELAVTITKANFVRTIRYR